ncbi:MAG: 2-oxoglutarate dehydrogenase complex dihydrolipoyllysine-residue succinyltransferase [Rhizobiales bacterium]|nr:2-oxoglutarate dehydrogenase complex dihydrolipoyllysine-residue succinyltransferase [Hyphomicrobiales bacterium]
MSVEIRVPSLGESVTEATVAKWFKQIGETVTADEPLVELETDKVTLEYNAPASGTLTEILVEQGGEVEVGALLGAIDENGAAADSARSTPEPSRAPMSAPHEKKADVQQTSTVDQHAMSPAVRKLIEEHEIDPAGITPSGPKGNITKGDVLAAIESGKEAPAQVKSEARPAAATEAAPKKIETSTAAAAEMPAQKPQATPARNEEKAPAQPAQAAGSRSSASEERVKMTRLRRRIAERLKEAQNTAAILTTYNEADMSGVIALRQRFRDAFEKKHGVKLGFMSFFVKATIAGLREIPALNAEIDGDDIVYKHNYDIGVAVGTPSGLVVPIVRGADHLSFADCERAINELGLKARDGKLAMDDLVGGTFTISNGGVYGSLMSSPILNPPQVGILGMHKIQERPVAVNGEIAIRPMMYLALSYDHRIVDGREAVTFLVRVKEFIEDPERLLLDV